MGTIETNPQITDLCYNMKESQKHHAKLKESATHTKAPTHLGKLTIPEILWS